jgi:quercetin dioxygenase-like cupin family protein
MGYVSLKGEKGSAAIQTRLSRPFRPIELTAETLAFFALPSLTQDLKSQDEYDRSGVSAITLARDDHVTLVLVALRKGTVMREHRAPSAATLLLLSGRVEFVTSDGARTDLDAGSLAAFSADVLHAVEALEDAAYLVIIGGRDRRRAAS